MTEEKKLDITELAKKTARREKMSEEELAAWIQIITSAVYKLQDRLEKLKDI